MGSSHSIIKPDNFILWLKRPLTQEEVGAVT